MIRTVIIGSGNIAHTRHIPNIRRSGLAVLHGIYNRSLEHSRKDAGELGCKAYTCLDEIWADSCVDAVIICTPASTTAGIRWLPWLLGNMSCVKSQ